MAAGKRPSIPALPIPPQRYDPLNEAEFRRAIELFMREMIFSTGTSSGLDADTLDGLDSTAFALASHTHALTDLSDVTITTPALGNYVRKSAGDWVNVTISQVLTDLLTVDGPGSGLDADLLDGQSGAYYAVAANVLLKDGSVALTANWDAGTFEIRSDLMRVDTELVVTSIDTGAAVDLVLQRNDVTKLTIADTLITLATAGQVNGPLTVGVAGSGHYLVVNAQDGTNEGGQIILKGAPTFNDWYIDSYQNQLRLFQGGTTYFVMNAATGLVQLGDVTGGMNVQFRSRHATDYEQLQLGGSISRRFDMRMIEPGGVGTGTLLLYGGDAGNSYRMGTFQVQATSYTLDSPGGDLLMGAGAARFTQALIVGTDPGGADQLRVGGGVLVSGGKITIVNSPAIDTAAADLELARAGAVKLTLGDTLATLASALQVNGNVSLQTDYTHKFQSGGQPILYRNVTGSTIVNAASTKQLILATNDVAYAYLDASLLLFHVDRSVRLNPAAGDPASLSNGMIWYDSTSGKFRVYEGGAAKDMLGGGGAPAGAQYLTLAVDGGLSAERVLTMGVGLDLTDGGAGGNATLDIDITEFTADPGTVRPISDHVLGYNSNAAGHRKMQPAKLMCNDAGSVIGWEECFSGGTGATYGAGCVAVVNGTGAGVTAQAGEIDHPGIFRGVTGTTATGRAAFVTNNDLASTQLGSGKYYCMVLCRFQTASTSVERYTARLGWGDIITGEPTDGVYFRHVDTQNSGLWVCVARSNNVESVLNTGIGVGVNTWRTFEIIVNGTVAEYFIDGVSQGTINTNVPTGASRQTTPMPFSIIKSVGTTSRYVDLDAYAYSFEAATTR